MDEIYWLSIFTNVVHFRLQIKQGLLQDTFFWYLGMVLQNLFQFLIFEVSNFQFLIFSFRLLAYLNIARLLISVLWEQKC